MQQQQQQGGGSSSNPDDLTGKVAFIAGVADGNGMGYAVARALSRAGATVVVGTWPPVLPRFRKMIAAGEVDASIIAKIYPLDVTFDAPADVPEAVATHPKFAAVKEEGFTVSEVAAAVARDYGKVDILIHSIANGPEVSKPLLETSRAGYLAAVSSSTVSVVSMVQRFGPHMPPGGAVASMSALAAMHVIPGYGGGMSGAKAALESDVRTLAWEAGRRWGLRVNAVAAGSVPSTAALAIGKGGAEPFVYRRMRYAEANAPLTRRLTTEDVGDAIKFLVSDAARGVTGQVLHVDNGITCMGIAVDSRAFTPDAEGTKA